MLPGWPCVTRLYRSDPGPHGDTADHPLPGLLGEHGVSHCGGQSRVWSYSQVGCYNQCCHNFVIYNTGVIVKTPTGCQIYGKKIIEEKNCVDN